MDIGELDMLWHAIKYVITNLTWFLELFLVILAMVQMA